MKLRVNVCCTFLRMQLGTTGHPRYIVFLTSTSLLQRTRVALVMEFNKSRSARQNLTVIRDEGGTRTLNLQLSLPHHISMTIFRCCSLDHFFTISGRMRMVSTESIISWFPRSCLHHHILYSMLRYSPI